LDPHIAALEQTSRDLLSDVKTQDTPTGQTPRKRRWDYVDSWALTDDRETILQAWRNRDPTPSLSTSITASDDLKSEPGMAPEQETAVIGEHMSIDPMGSEQAENLIHEPQSDVDMGGREAVMAKIGRPASLIPPPGIRRSTIVHGVPGIKFSGFAEDNIATRSKRLKR
jgi:hypothetical protein